MNFELDQKYIELQEQARAFAASIEHLAAEADEMSEIHTGLLAALRESELSRLMVPKEHGGNKWDDVQAPIAPYILFGRYP